MAKVPIRIKQSIRAGNYLIGDHCSTELAYDGFSDQDAVTAVLNAEECDKLTGDESHIRFVIYGLARDGREIDVVVMIHEGTIIFKTAYENHG